MEGDILESIQIHFDTELPLKLRDAVNDKQNLSLEKNQKIKTLVTILLGTEYVL